MAARLAVADVKHCYHNPVAVKAGGSVKGNKLHME